MKSDDDFEIDAMLVWQVAGGYEGTGETFEEFLDRHKTLAFENQNRRNTKLVVNSNSHNGRWVTITTFEGGFKAPMLRGFDQVLWPVRNKSRKWRITYEELVE